jgi:DNA-binding MurR/RpiR family transcriptional regulator
MSAAQLGPGDVAIALSHSGRSTETVDMLAQAKASGATTVAITNFSTAAIADVAEHLLCTSVRETSYRSAEMSARHSQFLVLDLLYLAVAQRTHERATEPWTRAAEAVAPHRTPYEPRARRGAETGGA